MEEAKRKEIEARLYQLMSQTDFGNAEDAHEKKETKGATIIRRRKGKPDVRVL